jgi:hypothetical protein
MNKTITAWSAIGLLSGLLSGCGAVHQWGAETPPWTPGLVADEVAVLQVANPNVIDNPPPGVVVGQDGPKGVAIIKAYRESLGDAGRIREVITPSATGVTN